MIKLNITQKCFEKHCSSATNADAAVFDFMQGYLNDAESSLSKELGFDYINDADHLDDNLIFYAEKAVCLCAYGAAIPHLDLVLTPTGFGVVSTNNVVPASAERVNRLKESVLRALQDTVDAILELLVSDNTWNISPTAQNLIKSYFWTGRQLRHYKENACRNDLFLLSPEIDNAENFIIDRFGLALHSELITSMRTGHVSLHGEELIELIRAFIIGSMDNYDLVALSQPILRYLFSHLGEFPAFENSSAYIALKMPIYENDKQDSCFFFG